MTTVDRAEVLVYVREQIAKHLAVDVEQVQPDMPVYALPDIDSLKAMRAITEVEKRFGVTAPVGEIIVTRTVGEVADVLHATIEESRS
ncbi:acyl carrier protein [Allokutzneria albata]|uniref:Acyl carrier protein n=1 Tax=Allokutzneria albata TaxID=211114 RepID=A0A1G9T5I1_ALLAB|nr:acyl carrier protein [Allokutzneria albata]SDM42979.1 Acyl carrier protein [Allokutzneria albata]